MTQQNLCFNKRIKNCFLFAKCDRDIALQFEVVSIIKQLVFTA